MKKKIFDENYQKHLGGQMWWNCASNDAGED